MFEISVGMRRRFRAYEFLTVVTEGVVHSVHKVAIQSSFDVIQRQGELRYCSFRHVFVRRLAKEI